MRSRLHLPVLSDPSAETNWTVRSILLSLSVEKGKGKGKGLSFSDCQGKGKGKVKVRGKGYYDGCKKGTKTKS